MRKQDLAPYFGSKEAILKMFPAKQRRGKTKQERHIYVDNDAPFLLVAHIDTVHSPRLDQVDRGTGFDDRLGVYLGHKLVRERSDLFDLLLTDYEEWCASTALYFMPSHDYKLVIELDREGEDYVDYGLASDELHSVLKANGFTLGQGSFSDICFMDQVECNKINLGLGTKCGHSTHSRFDMEVFERQTKRLTDFAELYRDATWPKVVEKGWRGIGYEGTDCCDLCLKTMHFQDLIHNQQQDCWTCPDCARAPGVASDAKWLECESCGDPCSKDELIYDRLYDRFLCATCHYILSEDHNNGQALSVLRQ